jgi:hypothetical protein
MLMLLVGGGDQTEGTIVPVHIATFGLERPMILCLSLVRVNGRFMMVCECATTSGRWCCTRMYEPKM